jgi:microcystin-dependent protein
MSANATHNHTFTTSTQADHNHTVSGTTGAMSANESHSHTVTVNNTGGGLAHENRPPYYALAYIVKT